MSIEEIRKLVAQEKDHEAKVLKAREEAARIIQEAETQAKKILFEEAENGNTYDSLLKTEAMRLEQEKKKLNDKCDREIERLKQKAESNMKEAIDVVVKHVLPE